MADKKLTTAEILAKLRSQDSGGGSGEPPARPPAEATLPEEPAADAPRAAAPTPAAKPSSTADILAAARAQAGGGAKAGAKPKSAAPPGGEAQKPATARPGSTADILAAARAQGGGGTAGGAAKSKPATAGATPPSTSNILAAARAQGSGGGGGGGAAPQVTTKTSPAKSAAAKTVAAPPVGERPSVAEMVKAARAGRPLEDPAARPVKPKLPTRPALPRKAASDSNRRGFFVAAITTLCTPYYFAWTVMAGIGAVWTLLVARFMMPNMIVEPPTKFKIGPPSDYPLGAVSTKWKAERGIWVVHTDSYDGHNLLYALASVCTHLGCTPNWLEGEQKFKCPCHGSGFYISGINFEGPAPRPLERVGLRLSEDGSLEVDKSVKYQEELGQWQDPSSFVELT